MNYLQHGRLPEDQRHRADIRRRAPKFVYFNDSLYRRSYDGILLRCLSEEEAAQALEEAGICGAHQSGPKLHSHLKRMGSYWPSMIKDAMVFARRCPTCQYHADFIHQPPEPLHPTVASWPFEAWGMDVIGPLKPKSSGNHQYILAVHARTKGSLTKKTKSSPYSHASGEPRYNKTSDNRALTKTED